MIYQTMILLTKTSHLPKEKRTKQFFTQTNMIYSLTRRVINKYLIPLKFYSNKASNNILVQSVLNLSLLILTFFLRPIVLQIVPLVTKLRDQGRKSLNLNFWTWNQRNWEVVRMISLWLFYAVTVSIGCV